MRRGGERAIRMERSPACCFSDRPPGGVAAVCLSATWNISPRCPRGPPFDLAHEPCVPVSGRDAQWQARPRKSVSADVSAFQSLLVPSGREVRGAREGPSRCGRERRPKLVPASKKTTVRNARRWRARVCGIRAAAHVAATARTTARDVNDRSHSRRVYARLQPFEIPSLSSQQLPRPECSMRSVVPRRPLRSSVLLSTA